MTDISPRFELFKISLGRTLANMCDFLDLLKPALQRLPRSPSLTAAAAQAIWRHWHLKPAIHHHIRNHFFVTCDTAFSFHSVQYLSLLSVCIISCVYRWDKFLLYYGVRPVFAEFLQQRRQRFGDTEHDWHRKSTAYYLQELTITPQTTFEHDTH